MTDATNKVSQELADAIIVLKPAECRLQSDIKTSSRSASIITAFLISLVIPQSLY